MCDFLFIASQTPSEKWSAPSGHKFFPYRVDPFSDGNKTVLTACSHHMCRLHFFFFFLIIDWKEVYM